MKIASLKSYFGLLLVFATSFLLGHCLTCQHGAEVQISSGTSLPFLSFATKECNDEESCVKANSMMNIMGISVEATGAMCIESDDCDKSCKFLFDKLIESLGMKDMVPPSVEIGDCDRACCKEDNCNSKSVAEINSQ